jgi:hypothetical protein
VSGASHTLFSTTTEGDSSSFFTDGCTLFAGTIGHNGDHLVQVHSKGLLLLNSDSRKRLCDFDLSAGETAVAACAAHPFVAVLMSTGAVRLFKVAAGDTQLEELPSSISGMCSVSIFDGQVCTDTANSENMHLLVLCSRAGSLEILYVLKCSMTPVYPCLTLSLCLPVPSRTATFCFMVTTQATARLFCPLRSQRRPMF